MISLEIADTVSRSDLEEALLYRLPMAVTEIRVYNKRTSYPICPRCHRTLEREYMQFCDRCGQMLMWKQFHNAKIHHHCFSYNDCERGESHGFLNIKTRKKPNDMKGEHHV